MKTLRQFFPQVYSLSSYAAFLGIFLALLQVPARTNTLQAPLQASYVEAGKIELKNEMPAITEEFFGEKAYAEETSDMIDKKVAFVSSRHAYSASLAVIQKHEKTIKAKASENGVPEDVAIGVGLLENGGSETAKSSAGALGVFQLMPSTARSLGLTVNKNVDERKDPEKNIEAGMKYLRSNYDRFGDWGLATWAYHAGEGNVAKALKIYAKANQGITLPGVKEASALRAYVEKYHITIDKLLSDASVKTFTNKLKDDSSGYPYKVIATAKLFNQAQ